METKFQFKCPHCKAIITEKDFEENEFILSHLKDVFNIEKDKYVNEIRKELTDQIKAEQERIYIVELSKKESEFNNAKKKEIDDLIAIINDQKISISKIEINAKAAIAEKTAELNEIKNNEVTQLKEIIANLKSTIKNNEAILARKISEKENEFNVIKQKEIDSLNLVINSKNLELESKKSEFQKKIADNEKAMLIKQGEIIEKYTKETQLLKEENQRLSEANLMNKVIQNKIKGETFEHDVEGELRKTFPDDIIKKITSQDKKADYVQSVQDGFKLIGNIVYEVKNAAWSNSWEKKLVEDMAKEGSKYGIIVATSFNTQYRGIPFKKSDVFPNIYLCDADSFYFVGQILRTLIKIEYQLKDGVISNSEGLVERVKLFNNWKETQFPKVCKIFAESFEKIKVAESGILKRVDEIRIAREKSINQWTHNIKEFIESFNI